MVIFVYDHSLVLRVIKSREESCVCLKEVVTSIFLQRHNERVPKWNECQKERLPIWSQDLIL